MKKIFIACAILLIVGLTGVYFFFDFIQRETTKSQQQQINLEIKKEETAFKETNEELLRLILVPVLGNEYQVKKEKLANKLSPELLEELYPSNSENADDVMDEIAKVYEVTTVRLKNIDKQNRQTTTCAKVLTQGGKEQEISVVAKYQKNGEHWVMRGITPVENSDSESKKNSGTKTSSGNN